MINSHRWHFIIHFLGLVLSTCCFVSVMPVVCSSYSNLCLNSCAYLKQDETGVYKNLLQEISQRVGAPLPSYTTFRTGLGHLPVFTCTVELAGITFTGEPAKNKKQAEKNAAMAAWSSLKQCECLHIYFLRSHSIIY